MRVLQLIIGLLCCFAFGCTSHTPPPSPDPPHVGDYVAIEKFTASVESLRLSIDSLKQQPADDPERLANIIDTLEKHLVASQQSTETGMKHLQVSVDDLSKSTGATRHAAGSDIDTKNLNDSVNTLSKQLVIYQHSLTNSPDIKRLQDSIDTLIKSMPAADQVSATIADLKTLHDRIDAMDGSVAAIKAPSAWPQFATVLAAIIAAVVAVISLRRNTAISKATLAETSREERRQAIRSQIDNFYGPFLQLRGASHFLYDHAFMPRRTETEKAKYPGVGGGFRTVTALIAGHKFIGVDAQLVHEMIRLGQKTAELIYTKSGLVDDPELQAALAQAATHFKIMELAEKGALKGGGSEFADFVFPRDLDRLVQFKLNNLNQQYKDLQIAQI